MLGQQLSQSPPAVQDRRTSATDGQLIAACLKGDSKAWESLIDRYARLIYSIPFKHGLSEQDAADVFQSVCLILLEKLSTLREHSKLSAWLITTTTRECWSVVSKHVREREKSVHDDEAALEAEISDDEAPPEEMTLLLERQQLVREGVQRLPDRCQKLIWQLFYRKTERRTELSYADIARRLGIPEGSIGPTRARCLEKLRRVLVDLNFE